ncbi:helix-turn-helix domain-containing protein [Virgibacillus chiguensis]|uniref:DNA-binding transcriptional regulator, XRE-family HTH domain n=1 Tax=Virgibacillus chiguensis TaxID=411959 RepID=A0A1M5RI43_9BACI|nr:helix-turn-helix transcriptional regulator [Virgibacillus chiguensis]SHH26042.1 DNA-binding transcriptional regulator, XRE-family HTH domain [Virgibacillus chiguensis]
MEEQANTFGEQLKQCRVERDWSQEKLATELHVSRQAVYKWETNKSYPDIQNLIRISDLFNITIDELIRGDKQMQKTISIDDDELFDELSDPGFYIGMILILVGVLIFDGPLTDTFLFIGLIMIVFFTDTVQSLKNLFKS